MEDGAPDDVARAYVRLGRRLGRVVPGLVDARLDDSVPAPGADRVEDEPPIAPSRLRAEAATLRRRLAADHPAGTPGVPESVTGSRRVEFLDAQLEACEAVAARADGERLGIAEEIRRCLGVEVAAGDEDVYREAHRSLAALLDVPLRRLPDALARFRAADQVPAGLLRPGIEAVVTALRARTATTLGLPRGEHLTLEVVDGSPWAGLTRRTGPGRSVMAVAGDAGHRMSHLPLLAAHEAYPGHHTETARAELGPRPGVPPRSLPPEARLQLARTPQSLVAEGVAETGLPAVVGPGWGAWAGELLAAAGLPTGREHGALGEAVEVATEALAAVRQDAVLLLHGGPAGTAPVTDGPERAREHLRRWLLVDDARARRMLEFPSHPRWRIHTTTYVEGARLVRRWFDARPAGVTATARYARLLDETWTPGALARDVVGTPDRDERSPVHADDTPGQRH